MVSKHVPGSAVSRDLETVASFEMQALVLVCGHCLTLSPCSLPWRLMSQKRPPCRQFRIFQRWEPCDVDKPGLCVKPWSCSSVFENRNSDYSTTLIIYTLLSQPETCGIGRLSSAARLCS